MLALCHVNAKLTLSCRLLLSSQVAVYIHLLLHNHKFQLTSDQRADGKKLSKLVNKIGHRVTSQQKRRTMMLLKLNVETSSNSEQENTTTTTTMLNDVFRVSGVEEINILSLNIIYTTVFPD